MARQNMELLTLKELVELKALRDRIAAIEARGVENFVDGVALPLAQDDLLRRERAAWERARLLTMHVREAVPA